MSSHNFALRERTPTPVGILYRLTKLIGSQVRTIWDGKDLNDMNHRVSSLRNTKLPWWSEVSGIKILFRLERQVNGSWEECEDPRFHR